MIPSREAADMAPSHQPVVFLPPRAALIGRIGDDPGCAHPADGPVDNRAGLARCQHQFAANILARIIRLGRARTDVDEGRRDIGRQAVLRERQGHRLPVAEPPHPARATIGLFDFPEFRGAHVPHRSRLLGAEHRLAVGCITQRVDGIEAIGFELPLDVPRRHQELLARSHTML